MGIFTSQKNYASIVSPLKKIESDLSSYIGDQQNNITNLNTQKQQIETKISDANLEIKKSQATVVKISELLSFDLDDNGVLDSDEMPPEPETDQK